MRYSSRHFHRLADGSKDYSQTCHAYYRYDSYGRYTDNDNVYQFVGLEHEHTTPTRPCISGVQQTLHQGYDQQGKWTVTIDPAYWRKLTTDELLSAPLTNKNATIKARTLQANAAKKAGYTGPIKGGEARAMSRFLTELGKPDHVRRCWFMRETEYTRYPGTPYEHKLTRTRLQGPIYVFKPLVEGFSFTQFMQIVRMYKPGVKGGCRAAIRKAMSSPDMAADLDMLNTLDTLAGLVL